ncbi:MAG: molecular chaperone DnaK [Gammaproteobacteria bacterium]|nr:molecular chaperone DnaK [Gammaproteobacteria bacterium]
MSKIIGIDLGTTNSCVCVYEGKESRVLENAEGGRTTPSIVAYSENGEILVGQAAKRQAITNPTNTIQSIKRLIGRRFSDDEVRRDIEISAYEICEADSGDAWVRIKDRNISPQEISSHILKKMKEIAENYLGETVTRAVITVPAYFNDQQRQATKDSGRLAGLDVDRIINEPTAAALAYGIDKEGQGDRKIAVYDLGGGTFDVSIIEMSEIDGEYQFEVLSTNGDTFLGGVDLDNRVINHLIDEFKRENPEIDLRKDPHAVQRICDAAEKAKIELSSSQQTEVNLPYITADNTGPKHLNIKITRAKLESLVEDLVKGTIGPCQTALKDAGLSGSDIKDVILVGGQTRMPMVQKCVSEIFGSEPRKSINPDEAVAIGAGLQASVISGDTKNVLLLDVTSLSLGIETLGGVMTRLIEKNTTIPTKYSQVFSTAEDNQTAVTIHILQGERERAPDNKSLGRFDLADISAAPRGMPQIEVEFDIDQNGILHVAAKDKATGRQQSIKVAASGGLDENEIQDILKDAEQHQEDDKKFKKLIEVRNQADSLAHSAANMLKEAGDKVDATLAQSVQTAIDEVNEAVKGEDLGKIQGALSGLTTQFSELAKSVQPSDADAAGAQTVQDGPDAKATDTDATAEDVVDADYEDIADDKKDGDGK